MRYHFTAHQEINCGLNEQSRQDSRTRDGRHHLVRPHASVRSSVHSRTLSVVNSVLALGRRCVALVSRVDVARPRARPPCICQLPMNFYPRTATASVASAALGFVIAQTTQPPWPGRVPRPKQQQRPSREVPPGRTDSHRGRHIRVFTDVEIIRSFPLHGKICFHSQVAISPRYGRSINDGFPRSGRSKASTKSRRRGVVCHASPKSD